MNVIEFSTSSKRPASVPAARGSRGSSQQYSTADGTARRRAVRAAFKHWNRGEWEAALEHVDPDVEWRTATPLLDLPQVSHGHDGVRAFWEAWSSSWTNIRIEPEEFIPAGESCWSWSAGVRRARRGSRSTSLSRSGS